MSNATPLHERQYNDYVVNVRIDRNEGPSGTTIIYFFLGDPPADVLQWETAPKVGMVTFMSGRGGLGGYGGDYGAASGGYGSARGEHNWQTGQTNITQVLIDLIESQKHIGGDVLRSLGREEVGRFLHKHLRWPVVELGPRKVPFSRVPSMRVHVATSKVTLPETDSDFPTYGPYEIVGSATKGRTCGYDPDVDEV